MKRVTSRFALLTIGVVLILTVAVACTSGDDTTTAAEQAPAATAEPPAQAEPAKVDDTAAMEKKDDAEAIDKPDDDAMATDNKGSADVMDKTGDDAMAMEETDSADAMDKTGDDAMAMETKDAADAMEDGKSVQTDLPSFIKAPHFVDSFPAHGDLLTQPPAEIVVNVNFPLHRTEAGADLTINGDPVAVTSTVSDDQLTLRIGPSGSAGDGLWVVDLDACWPDGSCHQGVFAVVVDSSAVADYLDLTGQGEVTVAMENIDFDRPRIVIDRGTTVTFVNRDAVAHFVNTDPHPSHNAVPELNSLTLETGDTYTFTFDRAGEYGYHCSAHTSMIGKIVVRG